MKVLLTGATGRLGSVLIKELFRENINVYALVRKIPEKKIPYVNYIQADITKLKTLKDEYFKVDAVINLAGNLDFKKPLNELYKVNAKGAHNLAKKSHNVKRFIHISTISVYGKKLIEKPASEKTKLNPDTAYSKSKAMGEKLIFEELKTKKNLIILRPADIYGPHFKMGYELVYKKIKKSVMPIIGNGKNNVSLIYETDLANAIVLALKSKKIGVYIISDKPITQEKVLDILSKIALSSKPRIRLPISFLKTIANLNLIKGLQTEYIDILSSDRYFNTNKAKNELNFVPKVSIVEGINEFVKKINSDKK